MTKNDYYSIACEDLKYLQATLHLPYYNQIAVQTQQIAEKMLKSVAEHTCVGIEKLMQSHNLRAIYTEIHNSEPDFVLNKSDLSMLKDFYFDAKYPGDNFVEVDKESCQECLDIMYSVIDETNKMRGRLELPVEDFERMMLE